MICESTKGRARHLVGGPGTFKASSQEIRSSLTVALIWFDNCTVCQQGPFERTSTLLFAPVSSSPIVPSDLDSSAEPSIARVWSVVFFHSLGLKSPIDPVQSLEKDNPLLSETRRCPWPRTMLECMLTPRNVEVARIRLAKCVDEEGLYRFFI